MKIPFSAVIVTVLLFGFLTGSTLFFFNKSRSSNKVSSSSSEESFNAELPQSVDANTPDAVDEATSPAEPRGRPSYPANVYTVGKSETLFSIGKKFNMPWSLIVAANGLSDANVVQSGSQIVIPKYNKNTDYYRINFVLNDDKLTDLNREVRDKDNDPLFDPIGVAKSTAVPYFSVKDSDSFSLVEEDQSAGTALVEAKGETRRNLIGLIQPKEKGKKGLWVVLYVERRDAVKAN